MIWKVCGMRDTDNIREVLALKPDYMGFIFYPLSPRNAENKLDENLLLNFPPHTKKVGVFANADNDYILRMIKQYRLDVVQLHGKETPLMCFELKAMGFTVVKSFGINQDFDWSGLSEYNQSVDYFLFDTKGPKLGGNGFSFDWNLLKKYKLDIPYFLSGGLSLENIQNIKSVQLDHLHAIDINSRFEIQPGLKDLNKLKALF